MRWFPITDPARADDIRMRRRRALLLLSSIVFVPWIMWGDHHAGRTPSRVGVTPFHVALPAGRPMRGLAEVQRIVAPALRIDLPCAELVEVLPDPTLAGQAVLSVPAGGQRVLDGITISGGTITGSRSCPDDSAVTIRTGNTMPLTLVQSGDNALRAGRFDSPVSIESTGSGTVTIEQAVELSIQGRGSGDVSVGAVVGPLAATMTGSGDLRVDHGTIPAMEVSSRGSGDLLLDHVQVLAGRATLDGSGDLHLGSVSGVFDASTHSSGNIVIGRVDAEHVSIDGNGSGDVSVGPGRIGMLDARRYGSGDLAIEAIVEAGTLAHDGSGDVSIPNGEALKRTR